MFDMYHRRLRDSATGVRPLAIAQPLNYLGGGNGGDCMGSIQKERHVMVS